MKACYKSDRLQVAAVLTVLFFGYIGVSHAQVQTWRGGGANAIWSTNAANWEGESVWVNGSSAIFDANTNAIFNGVVEVAATVTVANVTFQTNGYVIADADGDGTLTLVGTPEINVPNVGDTGTVSEVIAGIAGFAKKGNGQLRLTAANTYSGTTVVSAGVLRLSANLAGILGSTGVGNDTVVAPGATLDFNGCYATTATSEKFTVSGAGVDGKGVLINSGNGHVNKSIGTVTMLDDSTIGGSSRIDTQDIFMNGHTLTKMGGGQLCVRNVSTGTVVISAGQYTLLSDNRGLGGTTPGDTIVYGGILDSWGPHGAVSERIIFNGGTVMQGNPNNQQFTLTGYLTLNSNVTFNTGSPTSGVEVAGYMDGASGFTQANAGWLYITCDTNSYLGPTIINSGRPLWVGKPNLYSGVLGYGAVTNAGTLYAYSSRLCYGPLVNQGTLNCGTGVVSMGSVANSGKIVLNGIGMLGTGSVVNTGSIYCYSKSLGAGDVTNASALYFDATNAVYAVTNAIFGGGTTFLRYGSLLTLGNYFSNGLLRVGKGTVTLTNGAAATWANGITVADRQSMGYSVDPTNVTAVFNILPGASLTTAYLEVGDGSAVTGGGMTGVINQVGGTVRTFGWTGYPAGYPGEYDGLHFGHYPQAYTTYNMMGGTLTIDNGYRLAIAIDGTGWFHQSGGEVYSQSVVVNARDASPGGYGRLTVDCGVFNVGSNGITAGVGAAYLVEYGGAGGIVRASTNFSSSLNATLYGTTTNAITFDSTNFTITLSGRLTGSGGLNKTGSGTLVLSGSNTYSGATRVLEGRLTPASDKALPAGGVVEFAVSDDGSGGQLYVPGDLSLAGLTVGVANPEALDESKSYTIATYGGEVTGLLAGDVLPGPWYVYRDVENKRVLLRAAIGTMIRVR